MDSSTASPFLGVLYHAIGELALNLGQVAAIV